MNSSLPQSVAPSLPESEKDTVSMAHESLSALQDRARILYASLQSIDLSTLDTENIRKVVDLLLQLKSQLTPEEAITFAGNEAKKTPEFLAQQNTAEKEFLTNTQEVLDKGKSFLETLTPYLTNPLQTLSAAIMFLLKPLRENPLLFVSAILGILAVTGNMKALLNALQAGAGGLWKVVEKVGELFDIDIMEKLKGYFQDILLTVGKWTGIAVATGVGTNVAAKQGKKVLKKGAQKLTQNAAQKAKDLLSKQIEKKMGEKAGKEVIEKIATETGKKAASTTALRSLGFLGTIASRFSGVLSAIIPTEMGDGELKPGQKMFIDPKIAARK